MVKAIKTSEIPWHKDRQDQALKLAAQAPRLMKFSELSPGEKDDLLRKIAERLGLVSSET